MNLGFVLFAAFYAVWAQRRRFVLALAWPFSVYVIFDVSLAFLPSQESIASDVSLAWLAGLMELLLSTIVAVTTHRIVLLGGESVGRWGLTRWTQRETRFFAYSLGLILIAFVAGPILATPLLALGVPLPVAYGLWIIASLLVLTRFSLVLPAIAVGDEVSLRRAWRMSSTCQGKLFVVIVAFPVLASVPILLAGILPRWTGLLLGVILSNLMLIFSISALSMAYRELSRDAEAT